MLLHAILKQRYMDEDDRPGVHQRYPNGVDVPASVAIKLVLADETAKWHESRAALARNHRWMQRRRLAAEPAARWGLLCGWVTSDLTCLWGRPGRMLLCPSPTRASFVTTSKSATTARLNSAVPPVAHLV